MHLRKQVGIPRPTKTREVGSGSRIQKNCTVFTHTQKPAPRIERRREGVLTAAIAFCFRGRPIIPRTNRRPRGFTAIGRARSFIESSDAPKWTFSRQIVLAATLEAAITNSGTSIEPIQSLTASFALILGSSRITILPSPCPTFFLHSDTLPMPRSRLLRSRTHAYP